MTFCVLFSHFEREPTRKLFRTVACKSSRLASAARRCWMTQSAGFEGLFFLRREDMLYGGAGRVLNCNFQRHETQARLGQDLSGNQTPPLLNPSNFAERTRHSRALTRLATPCLSKKNGNTLPSVAQRHRTRRRRTYP
jgi:hypothetical protein